MFKNSRKAMGNGDLQFLKSPLPVQVEIDKSQEPINVFDKGFWRSIDAILD